MTLLYWRIGKRIQTEVLENQRADYGKEILQTLSAKLTKEFGLGFSHRNLRYLEKDLEDAILCAGKKTEQIELLELDQSGIHVAEYLAAIQQSRARLANTEKDSR